MVDETTLAWLSEATLGKPHRMPDDEDDAEEMLEELILLWDYTCDNSQCIESTKCEERRPNGIVITWYECPMIDEVSKLSCPHILVAGEVYCNKTATIVEPLIDAYLAGVPISDIIA